MKRIFLIILLSLAAFFTSTAQDRIYFNDSRAVDAIVDEVNDMYIYYRLFNNPGGPTCSTSVHNVHKIVYQNGEEQLFPGGIGFALKF